MYGFVLPISNFIEFVRGVICEITFPRSQAHLHHYTQVEGMDIGEFEDSLVSLNELISEYEGLDKQMNCPPPVVPRLQIAT